MPKTIVTCGGGTFNGFIDIDGLACAVAYAELLRLERKNAVAVLTDPLNMSVTPSLRKIAVHYTATYEVGDEYVIVDMSDPRVLETFIPMDRITEIYDHHFWHEAYWQERIGSASVIEYIGAAATLIWEEYRKRGYSDRISHESAVLLAHAIVSNTANFRSNTTSERDRTALRELEEIAKLEKEWITDYFEEQRAYIRENMDEAIRLDAKVRHFPHNDDEYIFGQMEIYDGQAFLQEVDLDAVFSRMGYAKWIFNFMDLKSGKTTIISNIPEHLAILSDKLKIPISGNTISLETIIFRKEIMALLE